MRTKDIAMSLLTKTYSELFGPPYWDVLFYTCVSYYVSKALKEPLFTDEEMLKHLRDTVKSVPGVECRSHGLEFFDSLVKEEPYISQGCFHYFRLIYDLKARVNQRLRTIKNVDKKQDPPFWQVLIKYLGSHPLYDTGNLINRIENTLE